MSIQRIIQNMDMLHFSQFISGFIKKNAGRTQVYLKELIRQQQSAGVLQN